MDALAPIGRTYNRATPDRIEVLVRALESGYTRTAACRLAGISKRHFYELLDRTDRTLQPYGPESEPLTFAEVIEDAEAAAQGAAEAVILRQVPVDPALAWRWLRRRRRADWGDPEAEERIIEIQQRVKLAKLEERLAELELLLLERERELPTETETNGSSSTGTANQGPARKIEIEYFDADPPEDPDPEAP